MFPRVDTWGGRLPETAVATSGRRIRHKDENQNGRDTSVSNLGFESTARQGVVMPINVVITCDTPEEVTQAVQMRDQLHRMCDEPLTVKIKGSSTEAEPSSSRRN